MSKHYFNKAFANHFNVYVLCPTTGDTLEGIRGDDKVICNCDAAMDKGGTHLISKCQPSTVEAWMKEHGFGVTT